MSRLSFVGFCVMMSLFAAATGCTTGQASSTPGKSTGLFGIEKEPIEVDTPKAFANRTQVVVGDFKVGFLNYSKTRATADGGFSNDGSASVSARAKLAGVDNQAFQAITDAAYRDLIGALETAGYEVLDRAKLTSHPAYANANTREAPYEFDGSPYAMGARMLYFTPQGFDLHMHPSDGTTDGFGWSNPGAAYSKVADEADLVIITANYVLDFVNEETLGGSRNWASVSIAPGLSIKPGSGITLIGGHGGTFSNDIGMVKLGQPVYTTKDYATDVAEVTSDAEEAGNMFAFLGGLAKESKAYQVTADPNRYQPLSERLLGEANAKLVNHMKTLR